MPDDLGYRRFHTGKIGDDVKKFIDDLKPTTDLLPFTVKIAAFIGGALLIGYASKEHFFYDLSSVSVITLLIITFFSFSFLFIMLVIYSFVSMSWISWLSYHILVSISGTNKYAFVGSYHCFHFIIFYTFADLLWSIKCIVAQFKRVVGNFARIQHISLEIRHRSAHHHCYASAIYYMEMGFILSWTLHHDDLIFPPPLSTKTRSALANRRVLPLHRLCHKLCGDNQAATKRKQAARRKRDVKAPLWVCWSAHSDTFLFRHLWLLTEQYNDVPEFSVAAGSACSPE